MALPFAKYSASINDCEALLKRLELLSARGDPRYPLDMPSTLRHLSYRDAWQKCLDEGWYELRTIDGSLFQFQHRADYLSYSFLEVPLSALPFEDFAVQRVGDEWELVEEELRSEYELYLAADLAERSVTPVRYDYEPKLYRAGVHPAGHFHFGISNNIRICAPKIPTPLSFVLFIVRQFFPREWEYLLKYKDCHHLFEEVRNALSVVTKNFLHAEDFFELQLS